MAGYIGAAPPALTASKSDEKEGTITEVGKMLGTKRW
jgi:hypothetical protein